MNKFLTFLFIISFTPQPVFSENLMSIDPLISSHPIFSMNKELHNLVSLFQQERYGLFLQEAQYFKTLNPNIKLDSLEWLMGHSHLQLSNYSDAIIILEPLTNSKELDIADRVNIDLSFVKTEQGDLGSALEHLIEIRKNTTNQKYRELAAAKMIHNAFVQKNNVLVQKTVSDFEILYPNSTYLSDVQYYFAQSALLDNNPKKAKQYAQQILTSQDNIDLRRLLAEIALQEQQFGEALKQFYPLTQTNTKYFHEATFKVALLYKYLKDYTNSHRVLKDIRTYQTTSPYYERALNELANIDIILKNYDDALSYFIQESGYTGARKAIALLKIAEINFLTEKTSTVRRTAERIQKEFPYSSFANEAIYWEGRSYLADKEYQESIETLQKYLVREPENKKRDEIMIFLAHSYANLKNHSQSRQYYQQIINESDNPYLIRKALLGLGRSYHIQEPKRSLEFFDRIWREWEGTSEAAEALYYSGAVRYNLRENNRASQLFQMLLDKYNSSPFYEDAALGLAKLRFKSDQFNNVLDLQKLTYNSSNKEKLSEFKELQARSFFRLQKYEDALILFREARELSADLERKTDLFLAEASALRNLGRNAEALKQYDKFLDSPTKNNDSLDELVWSEIIYSYLEVDDFDKSLSLIKEFQDLFPNSDHLSDLYILLADKYYQKKSYEKASKLYTIAEQYVKATDSLAELKLKNIRSLNEFNKNFAKDSIIVYLDTYQNHYGRSEALYLLSELCYANDKTKSETLLAEILSKFSDSPEAEKVRNDKVAHLSSKNSIDEFYEVLENTSDKGLRAKILYKLAEKFHQENRLDEAIQIYKDIHAIKDPQLGAKSLFQVGQLLMQQQNYQEALKNFVNIIAQYDEEYYPAALDYIIQNYLMLDQLNNAQNFKDRLLEQYSDSPEAQKWAKKNI